MGAALLIGAGWGVAGLIVALAIGPMLRRNAERYPPADR
jgi:hypothetical protein